ncbi:type II toxin-antitoxin system RelE/ParE family toxin [Nitrospirillum viridazoti]|uniref:type II toxin-antitoxin system RelE/ParE family toxin n=1 Tax=Nitrospirillum viridazoti TaxID=3144925 RepID=UPI0011ADF400|nr:type II toxin-antitoxin system RelE/ParE family toxin [Nitrospirillum amazonense]TWB39862.1 addiction module RelE/StbE family toxin [Nitrospirillum amazonense]
MKRIRWSIDALGDVDRHVAYIAAFNLVAAERVLRALLTTANSLLTFPNRGRRGSVPGTRELLVFPPYVIIYEVMDDEIIILRVWHGAQDRG